MRLVEMRLDDDGITQLDNLTKFLTTTKKLNYEVTESVDGAAQHFGTSNGTKIIKQTIIDEEIVKLKRYLKKNVNVGETTFTNEQLISLPVNKPTKINEDVWEEIVNVITPLRKNALKTINSNLVINESILDAYINQIQCAFDPDDWVEGILKPVKQLDDTKLSWNDRFAKISAVVKKIESPTEDELEKMGPNLSPGEVMVVKKKMKKNRFSVTPVVSVLTIKEPTLRDVAMAKMNQ